MFPFFAFIFCVLGAAVNVGLFIAYSNPWSLGGAIVCGFCALFNLAMASNQ